MTKINKINLDRTRFDAAPTEEKIAHIMLGQLANDVGTLNRHLLLCLNDLANDEQIIAEGRTSAALSIARLLAGRMYEGYKYLKSKEHGEIFKRYEADIGEAACCAREKLFAYFGNGANPLQKIRQKQAFHADQVVIADALKNFPQDVALYDYVSDINGNLLFYSATSITALATARLIGAASAPDGVEILANDTSQATSWINTYSQGMMVHFLTTHIFPGLTKWPSEEIVLEGLPSIEDIVVSPFFAARRDFKS